MATSSAKSKRNGKIEFYRFFFCIAVMLFHAVKYTVGEPKFNRYDLSLFSHGALGCEFFFIVSGYLMAASIFKKMNTVGNVGGKELATESCLYMKGKYFSVFPQHTVAFVLAVIAVIVSCQYNLFDSFTYILDSVPSFFLIQITGIKFSAPNDFEWYISAMLLAMAVIYPICRKWYYQFTRYFSWIIAFLLCGYLIFTKEQLTGIWIWNGVTFRGAIRAVAEISLGTAAFEIVRYIKSMEWKKFQRFVFSLAELGCFAAIVVMLNVTVPKNYDVYTMMLIFLLVILAFSEVGGCSELFNNKFFYFLGKCSLPIYLAQRPAVNLVVYLFRDYPYSKQICMIVLLDFALAAVVCLGGFIWSKIGPGICGIMKPASKKAA
ncbi:MAG: acyltransferase family protein [Acutalibacteraceae bacterium]